MKLAAAVVVSSLLIDGCGAEPDRPHLLSDAENDQSGRTPLISSSSSSGSSGGTSSDCTNKEWFGDFVVQSQADVKKLAGYTSVVGNVWVEPSASEATTDVSSLSSMRCLQTVYGSFTITDNPLLYDLSGLGNLIQVVNLEVSYNDGMGSLAGLTKLTISDTLSVVANNAMFALSSGIVAAGSLYIQDNPQLSQCIATALADQLNTRCTCSGNLDSATCN